MSRLPSPPQSATKKSTNEVLRQLILGSSTLTRVIVVGGLLVAGCLPHRGTPSAGKSETKSGPNSSSSAQAGSLVPSTPTPTGKLDGSQVAMAKNQATEPSRPTTQVKDLQPAADASPAQPAVGPVVARETQQPPAAARDLSPKEIFQRAMTSTALVVRLGTDGQVEGNGSGWVLDQEHKLLVTNHHVVVGREKVHVYFPSYDQGKLNSDMTHYLRDVTPIVGTVFLSEPERDLAVVQLESLPDGIRAFQLAADSASPGDELHSVGNPEGRMWFYTGGHVRGVYKSQYQTSSGQRINAQIVESDSATNHGDSGGPVLNSHGELAAVVSSGTDGVRLITQFIDVSEVRTFSEEVNKLLDPHSAVEFDARGSRRLAMGQLDQALADFTQAMRLDDHLIDALCHRGQVFRQRADYLSAIGDFDAALKLDSKRADAFQGRGLTHLDQGDVEAAVTDFTEAIRINPEDATNYALRGQAFARRMDQVSALMDFDRAIGIDPKNAPALFQRGELHYQREEIDAAAQDYLAAVEADPTMTMPYIKLGYILLYKRNMAEQGMQCFNKAVELNPSSDYNRNERGNAWFFQGAYQSAIEDYNEAIRLAPNDPVLYDNRGTAYARLGNYDQAIVDYTQAINLAPDRASFYTNRGNAYQLRGDQISAQADFDKASSLGAPTTSAQTVAQRTRYVRVVNETGETLNVYFLYHTLTINGDWAWYPGGLDTTNARMVQIEAGQSADLYDGEFRVHADAIRIWAVGQTSGDQWLSKQTEDVTLVSEVGGYQGSEPEVLRYTFSR